MFEDFLADHDKFVDFIVKELKYLKGNGTSAYKEFLGGIYYNENDLQLAFYPDGWWCMQCCSTVAWGMGLKEAVRNWAVAFVFDGNGGGMFG